MTPGRRDTASARDLLNDPEPLLVPETIRSARMASSTLLVAERDTDAPNTAMADTRAMPIMRADAVWAVRRGLRMEFSRPKLAGYAPNTLARGRPMALESGRATAGASMAAPTKMPHGAGTYEGDGGYGKPDGEQDATDDGDGAAPGEPAPGRDLAGSGRGR